MTTSLPNTSALNDIARALVAPRKGILAADESVPTAGKRLAPVGLENNEENRRLYRDLFFTTKGIGDYLSGVILFEETIGHKANDGTPFPQLLAEHGVIPGIKVDKGTVALAGFADEVITEGIDGLRERLQLFAKQGMKFAKWRAVILIDEKKGLPSEPCMRSNAGLLARYAALCQEAGIVPIIEPEVLYDKGNHSIEVAEQVTTAVLERVFEVVEAHRVDRSGLILKTSMVLAAQGFDGAQSTPEEVAAATLRCYKASVPADVGGIVFLSGGQSAEMATVNLAAVNALRAKENASAKSGLQGAAPYPWEISFSYGRGLQGEALEIWAGKEENKQAAQAEFLKRLQSVSKARDGK
ncbi:MAG: hypothetical protein A2666_02230 [Parcubacteria group bacterium RIFCSPHIGHO2_01_FULL_47_10b]|nr:MAG: hypothetical protein A2666_02230 [Parcubacteria group bacterium RIFCSPHIGHO2_01_FULL_47_10b]